MADLAFFLVPAVAGVALGLLAGGRMGRIRPLPALASSFLLVAAAAQGVEYRTPSTRTWVETRLHLSLLVVVYVLGVCGLLLAAASRHGSRCRAAALAVVLGAVLNGAVILANQGMPSSGWATTAARVTASDERKAERSPKYRPRPHPRLVALGDVLPLRPVHTVVSIGDVVMALGLMAWVGAEMGSRGPVVTSRPAGSRLSGEPRRTRAQSGGDRRRFLRRSRALRPPGAGPGGHRPTSSPGRGR